MSIKAPKPSRPASLTALYLALIDSHLDDLVKGRAEKMLEIEDFAALLFVHPTHLSNTIREVMNESACGVYQLKILETARKLLARPEGTIQDIAFLLTFDPSQFTKWFKRFMGMTPKQYRASLQQHPAE